MQQIAGAVMFVLFLVAGAAGVVGIHTFRHANGAAEIAPAIGLGLLALMALSALGVIAAILATIPPPARPRSAAPPAAG